MNIKQLCRAETTEPTLCKVLAICCLSVMLLLTAACGAPQPEAPPETYRVRGIIRKLPTPNRSPQELSVRHEAIPEFKNADGKVVGMDSMTMPFPLADPALIHTLEVGDRIEMQFNVQWNGDHPLEITAIDALPAETRLAFEPPAPEPSAAEPSTAEPSSAEPAVPDEPSDEANAASEPPVDPVSSS